MRGYKYFISLFLFLCGANILYGAADDRILPANQAFVPAITNIDQKIIEISIDIKDNYYLYKERLLNVSSNDIDILSIELSPGETKDDKFFGKQQVWYGSKKDSYPAKIKVFYNKKQADNGVINLRLQGCLDKVLCYPPEDYDLTINLQSIGTSITSSDLFKKNNPPLANKSSIVYGQSNSLSIKSKPEALSVDKAFQIYAEKIDSTTFFIQWDIADGYYLYQSKIQLNDSDSLVAKKILSKGIKHNDQFFGEQIVYRGGEQAKVYFYLKSPIKKRSFNISYQGCSDTGVCYPVTQKEIIIYSKNSPTKIQESSYNISPKSITIEERLSNLLEHRLWLGLLVVLFLGIPLFFTPCVLPMAPILLAIINNDGQRTTKQVAWLASCYVLGMALMMAVFGLVFSFTGLNLQFILQKPWLLTIFAVFFIIMGLGMLGKLTVGLPANIQTKVYQYQAKIKTNNPFSIMVIGALSSLVVGSCATPLLFALLAIISTLNAPIIGALSLFMLGFGMGSPLILFSIFSNKIPKTGTTSILITKVFAMLMFGVSLWLISRLFSDHINMFLWAAYIICFACLLLRSKLVGWGKYISYLISFVFIVIASLWIYGGIIGNTNILKPLVKNSELRFIEVNTLLEIEKYVKESNQPVMLDFYADWCVSCKELELLVFTDPKIEQHLDKLTLLRLDLTDITQEHRNILADFELVGPPVLLFFKAHGNIKEPINRIIGVPKIDSLLNDLKLLSTKGSNE